MRELPCATCMLIQEVSGEYSDPSIVCPDCSTRAVLLGDAWRGMRGPGSPARQARDDDDDDDAVSEGAPPIKPTKKRKRDDEDDEERPTPKRNGDAAKAGGMGIGVILAIVGGLSFCCVCVPVGTGVGIFFTGLGGVRSTAARNQSTNNLKNLGLAFHAFNDANRRLPFNGSNLAAGPGQNYSANAIGGNPQSGSWGFQILPFIDQGLVFGVANRGAEIPTFLCPGRSRPKRETSNGGGTWTDYFINGYVNDPMNASNPGAADKRKNLMSLTDGTSNTIVVGHGSINTADYAKNVNVTGSSNIFVGGTVGTVRAGNSANANPPGVTLAVDSPTPPAIGRWGGPFPNGALMGMGDATVRMFPYTTANFGIFLTPAGGEVGLLPD